MAVFNTTSFKNGFYGVTAGGEPREYQLVVEFRSVPVQANITSQTIALKDVPEGDVFIDSSATLLSTDTDINGLMVALNPEGVLQSGKLLEFVFPLPLLSQLIADKVYEFRVQVAYIVSVG